MHSGPLSVRKIFHRFHGSIRQPNHKVYLYRGYGKMSKFFLEAVHVGGVYLIKTKRKHAVDLNAQMANVCCFLDGSTNLGAGGI